MARHFLQLYLLIVITLAAVSWGQGRLWETYSGQQAVADAESRAQAAALTLVDEQLRTVPRDERKKFVADLASRTKSIWSYSSPGISSEATRWFAWSEAMSPTCVRLTRSGC